MKDSNKKVIIENIISAFIGLILYLIVFFICPSVKVNSIIDILLFAICFLLGEVIYNLLIKKVIR